MPLITNETTPGVCHIVSAAPGCMLELGRTEGDFVIAADGGYLLCCDAGVVPDLFIGDFDSLDVGELPADLERVVLPCEKDDTDTMAALKEGLQRGYRRFVVHAALGGDIGHSLANIQGLLYLRAHGADGVLLGGEQQVWSVVEDDGERSFETQAGTRVSVFAAGECASGVCERGLQWELSNAMLTNSFPLGVSNKATRDVITISVQQGTLLVVIG